MLAVLAQFDLDLHSALFVHFAPRTISHATTPEAPMTTTPKTIAKSFIARAPL
jgi:hypothetical protein